MRWPSSVHQSLEEHSRREGLERQNWVVHVVLATFRSPSPAAVSGHRINGRSENGIRDSHVPVVSRHGWYSIGADISFFSS